MKFKDLKENDWFISKPISGDNKGHGGFKGKHYIYVKIKDTPDKNHELNEKNNARRLCDGNLFAMTPEMDVILVG